MINATLDTLMAVDTIKTVVNNASGGSTINWFELIVVKMIIPVTIVAVAAIVATLTALRRYRTQKYWEMKLQAYTEAINALEKMASVYSAALSSIEEMQEPTQEEKDILTKRRLEGEAEIERHRRIGNLLYSDKALSLLDVKKTLSSARQGIEWGNYYRWLEATSITIDKIIDDMIQQAKKDLKLR